MSADVTENISGEEMVFDDEMMAREAAKVLAAIQEEVDGSMFITLTYCNSMLVLHCDQTLDRWAHVFLF